MDEKIKRNKGNPKNIPLPFEHSKIPPQAVDFEVAILGIIMTFEHALKEVIHIFKEEIFYKESHQQISKAILSLYERGDPIDILTVVNELKTMDKLDVVGGAYTVTRMTNGISSDGRISYYIHIVKQKHLQREIIRICGETSRKAYEETTDVFDLLDEIDDEITKLWTPINMLTRKSTKDVAESFRKSIDDTITEDTIFTKTYQTGWKIFDEKVETCYNKIVLMSGAAGDGKSRFVSSWMFRLLRRHAQEIAIKWVTLEDSAEDISTYFLSPILIANIKDIKRKRLNINQKAEMLKWIDVYENFDISFTEESQYIKDIVRDFEIFCVQRPGKLHILIIDNILSLKDRESFRDLNPMYDHVMNQVLLCKQRTKGLIIPVHHYRDAQMAQMNLKTGYRPRIDDLKGTEAFRRVPNQVLLSNNPSKRKDLYAEYYGEKKEILRNMFILDPGKIRDDDNDDLSALMYFYADLGYCTFHEIPRIIK